MKSNAPPSPSHAEGRWGFGAGSMPRSAMRIRVPGSSRALSSALFGLPRAGVHSDKARTTAHNYLTVFPGDRMRLTPITAILGIKLGLSSICCRLSVLCNDAAESPIMATMLWLPRLPSI
jgi:hypothetical protein